MSENTKICTKCNSKKDIKEFYDGQNWCKKCKQGANRQYRIENKEKIRENKKKYSLKNKKRMAEQKTQYYLKNKKCILAKRKQKRLKNIVEERNKANLYRLKNREKIRKLNASAYLKNKDKRKIQGKQYRLKNKDNIRAYFLKNKDKINQKYAKYRKQYRLRNKERRNLAEKLRLKNNIGYRILHNLRHGINRVLRGQSKSDHTINLVGCTIPELKNYLEKQFKENMTWDDYGKGVGKWNIDHIVPCSIFDFTDPIEQEQCFHFTNLQPLWERGPNGNLEKHNKTQGLKLLYNNSTPFI